AGSDPLRQGRRREDRGRTPAEQLPAPLRRRGAPLPRLLEAALLSPAEGDDRGGNRQGLGDSDGRRDPRPAARGGVRLGPCRRRRHTYAIHRPAAITPSHSASDSVATALIAAGACPAASQRSPVRATATVNTSALMPASASSVIFSQKALFMPNDVAL